MHLGKLLYSRAVQVIRIQAFVFSRTSTFNKEDYNGSSPEQCAIIDLLWGHKGRHGNMNDGTGQHLATGWIITREYIIITDLSQNTRQKIGARNIRSLALTSRQSSGSPISLHCRRKAPHQLLQQMNSLMENPPQIFICSLSQ